MAIPIFADRVKEISETTGTGTLELLGASTGFLTFVQGIGNANRCYYVISDGTQFEVGIGTVTAGAKDSLSRDTILQTSNNDTAAISWAGTTDVYVTLPASQIISEERVKTHNGRNAIINGDFRIAQRGSTNFSTNGYTLDRWFLTTGGGNAVIDLDRMAFSPGQISVAGEPRYYVKIDRTASAGEDSFFVQKIEDVRTFAGQEVTVSYWAKADTTIASGDLLIKTVQNFGTGGATTVATNFAPDPSVTTAWQRFTATMTLPSISGKTIGGSEDDYLMLRFHFDGDAGVNALYLANIQLEIGDIASDFEKRSLQEELADCQRYYFKTFDLDTVPAENAGRSGALSTVGGATAGRFAFDLRFPVPMRAAPTIVTFNTSAVNSSVRNLTGMSDTAPTVVNINETSALIRATSADAADVGDLMEVHVTADAEL